MAPYQPALAPVDFQRAFSGVFNFGKQPVMPKRASNQPVDGVKAFEYSKLATHKLSLVFKALPFSLEQHMQIDFEHDYDDQMKIIANITLDEVKELSVEYRTASGYWYVNFGQFQISFHDANETATMLMEILQRNYIDA